MDGRIAPVRCHVASMFRFLAFAQEVFELGEDLFDGVEVGAVGRQENQPRASRFHVESVGVPKSAEN